MLSKSINIPEQSKKHAMAGVFPRVLHTKKKSQESGLLNKTGGTPALLKFLS
jgi:hypothetical protein